MNCGINAHSGMIQSLNIKEWEMLWSHLQDILSEKSKVETNVLSMLLII